MPKATSPTRPRWWQRRGPSLLVLAVVLVIMAVTSLIAWRNVSAVLPEVTRDKRGEDPWEDPVGVELWEGFQVVRIPDCAVAPVVRIELWDETTDPYWVVEGPPTPLGNFVIGGAPSGFTTVTEYRSPPKGALLRLMVVRKVKGVAGVRFEAADLQSGYVVYGNPSRRRELEDFVTGDVCGDEDGEPTGSGSTTTVASEPD